MGCVTQVNFDHFFGHTMTCKSEESGWFACVLYFSASAIRNSAFIGVSKLKVADAKKRHTGKVLSRALYRIQHDTAMTRNEIRASLQLIKGVVPNSRAMEGFTTMFAKLWDRLDFSKRLAEVREACARVSSLVEQGGVVMDGQGDGPRVGRQALMRLIDDQLGIGSYGRYSEMSCATASLFVQISFGLPCTLMVWPSVAVRDVLSADTLPSMFDGWFGETPFHMHWLDPGCIPLLDSWVTEGILVWLSMVETGYHALSRMVRAVLVERWGMPDSCVPASMVMREPAILLSWPFGERIRELLLLTEEGGAFHNQAVAVNVDNPTITSCAGCGRGQVCGVIVPFFRSGQGLCAGCTFAVVEGVGGSEGGTVGDERSYQIITSVLKAGMLGSTQFESEVWDDEMESTALKNHQSWARAGQAGYHTFVQAVVEGRKDRRGASPYVLTPSIPSEWDPFATVKSFCVLRLPPAGEGSGGPAIVHLPTIPGDNLTDQISMLCEITDCTACVPLSHLRLPFMRASVLLRLKRDGKSNVLGTSAVRLFSSKNTGRVAPRAVGPAFVVFEAYSQGNVWGGLCACTPSAATCVVRHLSQFKAPNVEPVPPAWGAKDVQMTNDIRSEY